MKARWVLLALLLAALGGCANPQPEPPAVDLAVERRALIEADRAFLRALQDRGPEGWAAFFAEDGIQIPGGAPVAWGREQVRELAARIFQPGFSLSWEPIYVRVAEAGDLGLTVGNYVAEGTTPEGEPLRQEGNYVTLWRKQPDGSWKVALDIGNPGPHTEKPEGW